MRLAPAALTILLFAIVPASATAIRHAAPVYVVIVKGKPVPTPRRVAVHHSVTWFNNDKGAHRITSDHGRWPSFVLRYRKQHAVRFDRRGRYPYKVDGKASGVIIVGAGGGGSSGGQTTTLFHYDVHVSGHAQSIRTYSGETRADWNGTETLTVDWTSDFSNVTLKKISDSGTFVIGHLGGGSARGTTDATYGFKETRGDIYGPCQGTLSFDNLGTHLLLVGSRGSGKNEFTFWSQLDLEEGTRMSNEIRSQSQAACPGHLGKTLPSWNGGDFPAQGLTFKPFNDLLELHADRSDRATSLWFPLKQLSAGAPFTLETGIKSNAESCGSTCNAEEFLQLHADIKRHR